jgi:NADH-quinone oxidoreductase subunit N
MPSVLDNLQSLSYFWPEAALVAGVVLIILWDLVSQDRTRIQGIVAITLAALGTSGALSAVYLVKQVPALALFGGLVTFDPFAHLFRILFAAVCAVVVVFAVPSSETGANRTDRKGAAEFFTLLLIICIGLNFMSMSRNLLMVYLSLELVSVISFVMAGFKINNRRSSEGALKYVIYGGTASGVMLYGMSWLYGLTQSLDLATIGANINSSAGESGHLPAVVLIAVVCVMVGFGYKISAAPFHMWTPDVYEGAPTSITAFLSVAPKAAGFAILIRFFNDGLHAKAVIDDVSSPWAVLIGIIAMLTMCVGNLTAVVQDNVKRMLAYSSIAHAGYMLLALCVFNGSGVRAIMFYIVTYAFMNLGAFLVVAAIAEKNNDNENICGFNGLASRAPILAITMAIFLFSLAGLPPFAGFVGKFYIFAAIVHLGGTWNWILAVVGVVNSVISLFYYARVVRAMYLTKPDTDASLEPRKGWSLATIALAIPTLALGLYWGPIYDFVSKSLEIASR